MRVSIWQDERFTCVSSYRYIPVEHKTIMTWLKLISSCPNVYCQLLVLMELTNNTQIVFSRLSIDLACKTKLFIIQTKKYISFFLTFIEIWMQLATCIVNSFLGKARFRWTSKSYYSYLYILRGNRRYTGNAVFIFRQISIYLHNIWM